MKTHFHRQFMKHFRKLPVRQQEQFMERLELFLTNPQHSLLHVHTLSGEKYPYESFNVNGNIRAIFLRDATSVTFYEIGSHSELY